MRVLFGLPTWSFLASFISLVLPCWAADKSELYLPLLSQAKAETRGRYQFAVEHKARIIATADDRSFYVLWYPPGAMSSQTPLVVTLHGSESWAFDEFYLWQEAAELHGCGILALQWWFGKGDGKRDYYQPEEMYPLIAAILQKQGVRAGRAMLHGFSRGAANSYALAFLDRRTKSNYFSLIFANAGGAATGEPGSPGSGERSLPGYPLYIDIARGRFGTNVFVDTHWALFAGGLDEHPERDGIPAMRRTAAWLKRFGGTVELFLEDPVASHGGFHQSRQHLDAVLRLFEEIRQR